MQKASISPVILCGGKGERLWPLSTFDTPKQFLSLSGSNSFFQNTLEFTSYINDVEKTIIVTNENHLNIATKQSGKNAGDFLYLLEPCARGTAVAAAMAAFYLEQSPKNSLMLILPSDHIIANYETFAQAINTATDSALDDKIVTFGIVPKSAETGYGYIKPKDNSNIASPINRFVEKPCYELAEEMVSSEDWLWNSGIFLVKPSIFLKELRTHSPTIYKYCMESFNNRHENLPFIFPCADSLHNCPSDSIDYAIMEHTSCSRVVRVDSEWLDAGSWKSLWKAGAKDELGNVITGGVRSVNTKNSFIHSEEKQIYIAGLENVVIIESGDKILIADINKESDVRKLAKLQLSTSCLESPIGYIIIEADEHHITAVNFSNKKPDNLFPSPLTELCKMQIKEYFNGDRVEFTLDILPRGTDFQNKAWNILQTVKFGETQTYGEVSSLLLNNNAARAIGNACNKNPIPLLIPCHRIIGKSGNMTGYASGIWRKKWLLEHEKKIMADSNSIFEPQGLLKAGSVR